MKRIHFIYKLIILAENFRKYDNDNRLTLEIYSKNTYSIEIRHYCKGVLKKWIILVAYELDNEIRQIEILNYIKNIKNSY